MINEKRIKEAEKNVQMYLTDGMLKKQSNETAKTVYLENSNLSLETAQKLIGLESPTYKPYLWIIVTSYYAMFYIANAVLLSFGYKVSDKISHKVTSDALIVFARHKLGKKLLEDYENIQIDALALAASKADDILITFDLERSKRSQFQYEMDEPIKKEKALTSFARAKVFIYELKKLLEDQKTIKRGSAT